MARPVRHADFLKVKEFVTSDDGTSTIEFVLMLPLFIMFLMLVTDASLLFLRHTTLMNVSRDTARIVSRHAMTPPEAKAYAEESASTVTSPATAEITVDSGFVTVVLTANASASAPFGVISFAVDENITVSVISTMEPV
jgi:Flp pilus assembly protein TadG